MDPVYSGVRRRVRRRSSVVVVLSTGATMLGLFVVMLVAFASCDDALSHLGDDLASPGGATIAPVPVPVSSCPALKLVATAATDANAVWRDAFHSPLGRDRFAAELTGPLASLDGALVYAEPRVPAAVAYELGQTRSRVELGRVQLLSQTSASEYLQSADVAGGHGHLVRASALVAGACGFTLAPPLPF